MALVKNVPKRSDGVETMARLMVEARKELTKHGVDEFDIEVVLTNSKTARSSLYHHFGSKFGLVYAAQLEELTEGLNNDNTMFRLLVETSTSEKEFFGNLTQLMHSTSTKEFIELRRNRIRVFSSATSNKKLADSVRAAQVEGHLYFAETLEILRDRGWIKPQFDLHTVTYMIHGLLFGHVLLDFSRLPELEDDWADVAISAIIHLVGGSEKFAPLAKATKAK
jgi:AcrR family transcriptional regulator